MDSCETKFNKLSELLEKHCIMKTIKKPSYDILVVSGNSGSHAIWLHNPSTSARVDLEPDTYLFGVSGCRAVKEDSPEYDPMSPCSVRWSFHRPGSKELVGAGKTEGGKMREEDIGVESAKVFISSGKSEPRLMTTEQAMKSCHEGPHVPPHHCSRQTFHLMLNIVLCGRLIPHRNYQTLLVTSPSCMSHA
jgi:hypothetical protein